MDGYVKIYIKNNYIGHVRYEIGDDRGNKIIRGLSVRGDVFNPNTIYEVGETDSNGISIYNQKYYLPSAMIPLEREELISAIAYVKTVDEENQEYGIISRNCNDFTSDLLSVIGKKGCVGDYLSEEQKEILHASQISDIVKCRIPRKIDNAVQDVKEKICNGWVKVNGYIRSNGRVEGYVRSCGRH